MASDQYNFIAAKIISATGGEPADIKTDITTIIGC